MSAIRFVLGDQLTRDLPALRGADPASDVILMVEVQEEATYVPHHPQKIAFVLSAMRHFAAELRAEGLRVDYVQLDDGGNTGSFSGELARAVARHQVDEVVVTEPGEWRVLEMMRGWSDALGLPVRILDDDRYLCSLEAFGAWSRNRRQWRMEYFYREMRRRTGWLMRDGDPEGGAWNFDADNREPLPPTMALPERAGFTPDAVTRQVISLVARRFAGHFGRLEPFRWAVTRADALVALDAFVHESLPHFGRFQDAMRRGAPFVFHSVLSPYLNVGLLSPREVCEAALEAYRAGRAPLPAVEGFVRQILGWREFIRGVYWMSMPAYAKTNTLGASRPLPAFFWTADTDLACLRETIAATRDHAYAHHIQRLMITGNFALLAGLAPREVEAWYLAVYADAYEWVELPNTHGMVLHADGGLVGSKPYAASGAYINRMSDYCGGCAFSPALKAGPGACPFNYLYWDFLMRNETTLGGNPRLAMPYRTLARMAPDRRAAIRADATRFLDSLG